MAAETRRDLFWDEVVYGHGKFMAISARGETPNCRITVELLGCVVNTEKESREMRVGVGRIDRARHSERQGLGQCPTLLELGAYFDFYRWWC